MRDGAMKIVITGNMGYIGPSVVQRLRNTRPGCSIYGIDTGFFAHCLTGARSQLLRGKPCQPMNSDMRVSTPSGLDTYPDISVYCNTPELADNDRTLLNPVVIVEVLSPSSLSDFGAAGH